MMREFNVELLLVIEAPVMGIAEDTAETIAEKVIEIENLLNLDSTLYGRVRSATVEAVADRGNSSRKRRRLFNYG